ncbi:MAG: glycosyltransferase 61 family protein [Rhodospirillales bacterium]|jgi:tetratricopeptide (TPR) repeat protein|nr:hypothetical protein [Rhodospirillaceae bacterium]MDP6430157.1 glycosyltransferase 61 family protein [Rhodospirillales bacterium]MDP6643530.1 glycosyltransferase 61 family protein [Rhodospirillales bacterium]MDP6842743.1 glycosyltransferase 61 family protein [Rhodospirillales bacterium]
MASLTLDDALELATGHFQAGRYDAANKVLGAILAEVPDLPDALNLYGLTAHATGALNEALAFIGRAVGAQPEDANFISNLGVVHKTRGEMEQAEACFRRAIELQPDKANFHFNLGQTLYEGNRDREAAAAYARAVELRPGYVSALSELGSCLRDVGRADRDRATLERALACFDDIAAIEPGFRGLAWSRFRVLRERARLEIDGGDSEAALSTCQEIEKNLSHADWLPDGATFAGGGVKTELQAFTIAPTPAMAFDADSVKSYADTRLLPGDREWFLADGDKIHFKDMANTTPEVSPYVLVAGRDKAVLRMPSDTVRISDPPLFLIGGSRNYYHWMLDYLPRLALAGDLAGGDAVKFLVNAERARFQDECFDLLGIDADRLVGAPDAAQIVCDELFVAPIPIRDMHLDAAALGWLRDGFAAKALGGAGSSDKRRLYVSRKDASLRRVANEAEVLEALKPFGFEVIVGGELTVAEQIRLFSAAEAVVAPNGAAFANLVFAPSGALVVELSAAQRVKYSFIPVLCGDCGHDFALLNCGSVPSPEQALTANNQDHDMHVPVAKLTALLRARL